MIELRRMDCPHCGRLLAMVGPDLAGTIAIKCRRCSWSQGAAVIVAIEFRRTAGDKTAGFAAEIGAGVEIGAPPMSSHQAGNRKIESRPFKRKKMKGVLCQRRRNPRKQAPPKSNWRA